jgi:cysteine desulfurase
MPTNVERDNIDLLSFSSHKIYGPKGVGGSMSAAASPRSASCLSRTAAGQERGFRSGTLNVTGIVGLGKACEIAMHEMDSDGERLLALRRKLEQGITGTLDTTQINGHADKRLPHITTSASASSRARA